MRRYRLNSAGDNSAWSSVALIILGLTIVLLTGCASPFPPAPASASSPDYNYLIGPGDSIRIIVWRNPELSLAVPVRPDGKLTTALVEDIDAFGKTSTRLARDIEKALGKYLQDPVVTVIVERFVGPYSEQVRVVGEAAKPQAMPYNQKMTVLDVMIAAGGLTDFADGNAASILRIADGGSKQFNVRLRDLIRRGDVSANVEMKPGDILIIPQAWF